MKTKQYVITGAPCSGKTTVIFALEKLGFKVVHEVARAFIEEELKRGISISDLKKDELSFEREILQRKLKIEESLPKDEIVFLDRAVPDSIAYFRINNLDPREPLERSREKEYNKVFLFERLIFASDRVRYEGEDFAERVHGYLREAYEKLGYEIVGVPVLSVGERVDYILRFL